MSDIPSLAQELVRLGTRCVFGIPGEGPSLLLLNELEKSGCAFHLMPHEAAGALAAGGYGRVAGAPGISLSIKGPGFSNMISGIAANWLDRNPALSLSESYGPGSPSYRQHKRLDHRMMVRPVVKAYANNVSPHMLPCIWDICLTEPPGPVHLDISHRMEGKCIDDGYEAAQSGSTLMPSAIARKIDNARRLVVIAGALATRRSWREQLAKLTIPVFTTYAGKGAFDEALPYAAGIFTNSGGAYSPEKEILPKSDLIVGLGLRTTELIEVKPLSAPLVVLDELTGNAKGLEAAEEIAAGSETFVEVLERLGSKEWGASEVAAAKARLAKKLDLRRWLPGGGFRATQDMLPETTMFFLDTGMFCTVGEHVLTARRPLQVTGSPLARSMGVALPTALGAALAARGTPVVIVTGDGGMRLYPEVIALAVRENLPLLVLLMTDGYFSSIRQSAYRDGLSQACLRVESSCWKQIVQAWGCAAERVDSFAALEKALKTWKTSFAPLFLELAFNADDYLAMTDGIR